MLEGQAIFYSNQNLSNDYYRQGGGPDGNSVERDEAYLKFMHFVLEFQQRNTYIYRYIFKIMAEI